ncbi:hypothetical protein AQUCO_00400294v1 [Aquilegia coerulea]|uniref:Signal peptidase complex subunit 2 n=1 Tax=Aquilegia coerulea TaxID=218851 RepID=A0A2G5EU66_AQUCA|nr:hypothetical protein AQUCO_00400294v1 [Aquilegia coerulea]
MANNENNNTASKNPKKTNLMDPSSIKHLLDESVSEIVTNRGYTEDVRMSNVRLLIGTIIIVVALVAQFYHKKFPENRNFLIGCILLNMFSSMDCCSLLHTRRRRMRFCLLIHLLDPSTVLDWWSHPNCPGFLTHILYQ